VPNRYLGKIKKFQIEIYRNFDILLIYVPKISVPTDIYISMQMSH